MEKSYKLEPFKSLLKKYDLAFNDEVSALIEKYFNREELHKGDIILSEGQVAKKLYFIETGLARTFLYDKEKEISSWFYMENQVLTSWHSFYAQSPSFDYIEILEDTKVYAINYDDFQNLLNENDTFNLLGRYINESILIALDYYSKSYQFLSAKEKYALILNTFPGILNRVKLGNIASLMGVSQETLSRIRAKG